MPHRGNTVATRRRPPCASDCGPWDRLGIVASTLCLLHCLALPILVSALTALPRPVAQPSTVDAASPTVSTTGYTLADGDWLCSFCCSPQTDRWMHCIALCVVAPVGGIALWSGFERHGSPWGLLLGAPSLVLLMLGVGLATLRPGHDLERTATLLGSLLLIAAHLCNRHFDRCRHRAPSTAPDSRQVLPADAAQQAPFPPLLSREKTAFGERLAEKSRST